MMLSQLLKPNIILHTPRVSDNRVGPAVASLMRRCKSSLENILGLAANADSICISCDFRECLEAKSLAQQAVLVHKHDASAQEDF
jgi:hypothetical protein